MIFNAHTEMVLMKFNENGATGRHQPSQHALYVYNRDKYSTWDRKQIPKNQPGAVETYATKLIS